MRGERAMAAAGGRNAAGRPQSGGGARPSRVSGVLGPAAAFARRRPGLVVALSALLGSGGLIGWNALNQTNRHPAPLFRPKPAAQAAPPAQARRAETVADAPAPLPVPRPDPVVVGSVPASAPPQPAPVSARSPAAPAGDPIGNLIRGGEPGSARPAEPRPDARVTAVQKALTKIGYGPLKPDGLLGATTRQALERFERDHQLPVTGGLGTRTTRQLASASGTQIE